MVHFIWIKRDIRLRSKKFYVFLVYPCISIQCDLLETRSYVGVSKVDMTHKNTRHETKLGRN